MLRGVRLVWSNYCGPSCPFPVCLCCPAILKLLAESFLASWLVTRTYWVAAQTSSLSIEYLFAHLNKSSIVVGGFLVRDTKKVYSGRYSF